VYMIMPSDRHHLFRRLRIKLNPLAPDSHIVEFRIDHPLRQSRWIDEKCGTAKYSSQRP